MPAQRAQSYLGVGWQWCKSSHIHNYTEWTMLSGQTVRTSSLSSYHFSTFGFRHDTAKREMKSQIGLSYFVHARPILMSQESGHERGVLRRMGRGQDAFRTRWTCSCRTAWSSTRIIACSSSSFTGQQRPTQPSDCVLGSTHGAYCI